MLAATLAVLGRTRLLPLLALALLPWPGTTRSALQTRAALGGRAVDLPQLHHRTDGDACQWLLLSNNPERSFSRGPERLLEQSTPSGRGRVLVSHIQLGWFPRDLVVRAHCQQAAHLRVVHRQSRDGGRVDAGSRILPGEQSLANQTHVLPAGGFREWRMSSVYGNAILSLEVESDRELRWTVDWTSPRSEPAPLPPLAMREGQSRGLYEQPDQVVELQGESGAWHWQGPWLRNQRGEPLLGNYGCRRVLHWTAHQPGRAWLVARGGVLGGPPFLAAGQSRLLLDYQPGPQTLELWLPVNSFAPFSVVLVPAGQQAELP